MSSDCGFLYQNCQEAIRLKTILIVDDDVYIGDMLQEVLSREGYQTARSYSGTEALMYLSSHRPDLILLDLMLPGLCGEELLPLIRDIPVIVVSAKELEDSCRKCMRLTVTDIRALAEQMGGRISAEKEGEYFTVKIFLKRRDTYDRDYFP